MNLPRNWTPLLTDSLNVYGYIHPSGLLVFRGTFRIIAAFRHGNNGIDSVMLAHVDMPDPKDEDYVTMAIALETALISNIAHMQAAMHVVHNGVVAANQDAIKTRTRIEQAYIRVQAEAEETLW